MKNKDLLVFRRIVIKRPRKAILLKGLSKVYFFSTKSFAHLIKKSANSLNIEKIRENT